MRKIIIMLLLCLPVLTALAQHEDHQEAAITLNKGKKWKVPADMMQYLKAMEQEVSKAAQTKAPDYKAVSKSLSRNTDLLTEHCTMEGAAHDALHAWLVPYIASVKKFGEAPAADKSAHLKELQQAFVRFHQYFE